MSLVACGINGSETDRTFNFDILKFHQTFVTKNDDGLGANVSVQEV